MRRKAKSVLFLVSIILLWTAFGGRDNVLASEPYSFVASFDHFQENYNTTRLTDGGITLSDLDRYLGSGFPEPFAVESVGPVNNLGPLFTFPNFLTFGGTVPGPGYGFGRFGSAKITSGREAIAARMDIFSGSVSPNTLTLQALLNGTVVATDAMTFSQKDMRTRLEISGISFDTLRLVSSGSFQNGAAFIGIDNVNITNIPEPATLLLLGLGARLCLTASPRRAAMATRKQTSKIK